MGLRRLWCYDCQTAEVLKNAGGDLNENEF